MVQRGGKCFNLDFAWNPLISFQNNSIEEEGAQALAEVLQCNRKLVTLK